MTDRQRKKDVYEWRLETTLDAAFIQAVADYVNMGKGTVTIEPGNRVTLAGKGVDGVLFQRIIEGLG